MLKIFCDICKEDCGNDQSFFCEIMANRLRQVALNPGLEVKPQIQQAKFHLCEKCFEDKLPELT